MPGPQTQHKGKVYFTYLLFFFFWKSPRFSPVIFSVVPELVVLRTGHVEARDASVGARGRLQPGSIHVAACRESSKPWAPGVAPVRGGSPAKDGGGERPAAGRGGPAQVRRAVHGGVGTRQHVGLASWVGRAGGEAALLASHSPRHFSDSHGAGANGARIELSHGRAPRTPLLRASAARVLIIEPAPSRQPRAGARGRAAPAAQPAARAT